MHGQYVKQFIYAELKTSGLKWRLALWHKLKGLGFVSYEYVETDEFDLSCSGVSLSSVDVGISNCCLKPTRYNLSHHLSQTIPYPGAFTKS